MSARSIENSCDKKPVRLAPLYMSDKANKRFPQSGESLSQFVCSSYRLTRSCIFENAIGRHGRSIVEKRRQRGILQRRVAYVRNVRSRADDLVATRASAKRPSARVSALFLTRVATNASSTRKYWELSIIRTAINYDAEFTAFLAFTVEKPPFARGRANYGYVRITS